MIRCLEMLRRLSRHNHKLTIANTRPEVSGETVLGQVLDQAASVRRDRVQPRQVPTIIGRTVILQRIHQLKLCKHTDKPLLTSALIVLSEPAGPAVDNAPTASHSESKLGSNTSLLVLRVTPHSLDAVEIVEHIDLRGAFDDELERPRRATVEVDTGVGVVVDRVLQVRSLNRLGTLLPFTDPQVGEVFEDEVIHLQL